MNIHRILTPLKSPVGRGHDQARQNEEVNHNALTSNRCRISHRISFFSLDHWEDPHHIDGWFLLRDRYPHHRTTMIELFFVLMTSTGPAVQVQDLKAACEWNRPAFHVTLQDSGSTWANQLHCRWMPDVKGHWEDEPVVMPSHRQIYFGRNTLENVITTENYHAQ